MFVVDSGFGIVCADGRTLDFLVSVLLALTTGVSKF